MNRLALFNACAAILVTLLLFPLGAIPGIAFSVAGLILGIRARRAAVAARSSEAAGVVSVVVGSIGLAMTLVIGAFWVLLWNELSTYQDCTRGANTLTAEHACQQQLEDSVRDRFGIPLRE
jgi:hypothetical protein